MLSYTPKVTGFFRGYIMLYPKWSGVYHRFLCRQAATSPPKFATWFPATPRLKSTIKLHKVRELLQCFNHPLMMSVTLLMSNVCKEGIVGNDTIIIKNLNSEDLVKRDTLTKQHRKTPESCMILALGNTHGLKSDFVRSAVAFWSSFTFGFQQRRWGKL